MTHVSSSLVDITAYHQQTSRAEGRSHSPVNLQVVLPAPPELRLPGPAGVNPLISIQMKKKKTSNRRFTDI